MGPGRLRVVVVDDVELARRREVVLLEADPDVEVVAEGPDPTAVGDALADRRVDVVTLVASRGGRAVPGDLDEVRRAVPGVGLVVLVGPRDDEVGPVGGGDAPVVLERAAAVEGLLDAAWAAAGGRPAADRAGAAATA